MMPAWVDDQRNSDSASDNKMRIVAGLIQLDDVTSQRMNLERDHNN